MQRSLKRHLLGAMAALATLVMLGAAPAFADQRDFVLMNDSGRIIEQIYVGPAGQEDYGDNLLSQGALEDTASATIKFARFTPGDCLYDIKVVTAEGDVGIMKQVNLCESTDLVLHGG
jgi:hypothetical protein